MRTPIRTVGAFGGSTEPAVLPGRTCLTYGRLRNAQRSAGCRYRPRPVAALSVQACCTRT